MNGRMWRVAWLVCSAVIVGALLVFAPSVRPSRQAAPADRVCEAASRLVAAEAFLTAFPVEVDDTESTEVSPHVAAYLIEVKAALRELIGATIESSPATASEPGRLQALIESQIRSAGLRPGQESPAHYGEILAVSVEAGKTDSSLLTVTFDLAIECGRDTSLLVFEKDRRDWRLSLVVENSGYTRISEAIEGLDFAASPRRPDGSYFLVATYWTPWCTSNWSGQTTKVLRPGPDPLRPRVLLDRKDFVYGAFDHENGLVARPDGFRLSYTVAQGLDSGLHSRERILAYRVEGDSLERVPPFADEPRAFLDEWSGFPLEEAEQWTLPEAVEAARSFHRQLRQQRDGLFTSFGEVVACPGPEASWLVRLDIEPGLEDNDPAPESTSVYVTVVERNGFFMIGAVSRKRPEGCPVSS